MKKLIKHFVDRAEGYLYLEGKIYWKGCYFDNEQQLIDSDTHFPLFIQRAIEGVNKENIYEVQQDCDCLLVLWPNMGDWDYPKNYMLAEYDNPDQAKISALQWIMEQEEKENEM